MHTLFAIASIYVLSEMKLCGTGLHRIFIASNFLGGVVAAQNQTVGQEHSNRPFHAVTLPIRHPQAYIDA
jgi:hypothetical protein